MRTPFAVHYKLVRLAVWPALLATLVLCARTRAAETVTTTIPAAVSFSITDVTATTVGSPNPFTVSYTGSALVAGHALYISVRANAANFTTPGAGTAIPCGNVSWTITGALRGTGSAGTLSTTYALVYTSMVNPTNGNVQIHWLLAPPPAGICAGSHSLSMTWKLESM
jgi:hypothetical protein